MVVIRGGVTDAFTHFTAIGLASIVESHTGEACVIHWLDAESVAVNFVTSELGLARAAMCIAQHATAHSGQSWVSVTADLPFSNSPSAPLSPRIGRPVTVGDWQALQEARASAVNRLACIGADVLDLRMLGGLGEPGYWCIDQQGEYQVDWAASSLEMKTRNRGEEFVQNRLYRLAQTVASRSDADITAGISGASSVDEAGKNALDSRTPTGLRPPSPTDNSQAWCALWGLSAFPVRPVIGSQPSGKAQGGRSVTAAVTRRQKEPMKLVMPVPERALTLARLRSVLMSNDLVAAANVERTRSPSVMRLDRLGVGVVVKFSQHVTDNPNAPERWLQGGAVIELSPSRVP